jgi:hypothetical protein
MRVRIRMFVDGELVDEAWPTKPSDLTALLDLHTRIADNAKAKGSRFMVEIYDCDAPLDSSALRWGTDSTMMRDPIEATTPDEAIAAIHASKFFQDL